MNKAGHGYARVPMPDGTFAMLDTFGEPTTRPTHVCDQWDDGNPAGPVDDKGATE